MAGAPSRPWGRPARRLPAVATLLAIVAHPDDESFGLGAVLSAFAASGTRCRTLCFTRGEASTLGGGDRPLGEVRADELRRAALVLGVEAPYLLDYPDGQLSRVPPGVLAGDVAAYCTGVDCVLVFDLGGVSGHPDHVHATAAALAVADASAHGRGEAQAPPLPALAWAVPESVATTLNAEFGTAFVGRPAGEVDVEVAVERSLQRRAIACHASQSTDNPVLWRRLQLLGDREHLCWLRAPVGDPDPRTGR